MPLLGFGIVFVGYSLVYYGVTQIRGGNWGLFDLMIPGKFDGSIPTDSGGTGSGGIPQPIVTPNPSGVGATQLAPGQSSPTLATGPQYSGPGGGVTQPPAGPIT